MDVLNIGMHIRQEMYFLANYGLFKNPISRIFFSTLFCIPVKRKEDVGEGEVRDNRKAFEASYDHLRKYGVLFIASEGTSWMNRFVRPFKTGAARIALGAVADSETALDLKIIPVGLSYSAPNLFRSNLVVGVGEPVQVSDYSGRYAAKPGDAVEMLTEKLEKTVRSLSLDGRDEEGEVIVNRLEELFFSVDHGSFEDQYHNTNAMLDRVLNDLVLRKELDEWYKDCESAGISAMGLNLEGKNNSKDFLLVTTGLPLFLLFAVLWTPPCFIPWWISRVSGLYIGYHGLVKMLLGFITFPIALWGVYTLVFHFTQNIWLSLATLPAFFLIGYFGEYYLDAWQRLRASGKVRLASREVVKSLIDRMQNLKDKILN